MGVESAGTATSKVTEESVARRRVDRGLAGILIGVLLLVAAGVLAVPLGIALLVAYVFGFAFLTPSLTAGAGNVAAWLLVLAGIVVAGIVVTIAIPRAVAWHNRRHADRIVDTGRLWRVWALLNVLVLPLAAWLTTRAVIAVPGFVDRSRLADLSPVRLAAVLAVLETAAFLTAWCVARAGLRVWQRVIRLAGPVLILLFALPVVAMGTCGDAIPDEALYPLPAGFTVVTDEQEFADIHDSQLDRDLVLLHPSQSPVRAAQALADHYRTVGWDLAETRWSDGAGTSFSGTSGAWWLSISSDTYQTGTPPDAVLVTLGRDNAGLFCFE